MLCSMHGEMGIIFLLKSDGNFFVKCKVDWASAAYYGKLLYHVSKLSFQESIRN